jgi:hypothetical protein
VTFWTPSDLADFADLVEDASPDVAIVLRLTLVPDPFGGQTESWDDIATVAAKVSMLDPSPTEQTIASQNIGQVVMLITLPAGTDVRPDDQIQIVWDGGTDLYEVVGAIPERSFEVRTRVIGRLAS